MLHGMNRNDIKNYKAMSNYQNRIDFISRTQNILTQYETDCSYEKTLFLNCCVGLLIMPQQCADHDENISVDGWVDYENWGIDTDRIEVNEHRKGTDKNSIENIAYHIRNSMCHYRFDVMGCNTEKIKTIRLTDIRYDGKQEVKTFSLELSFDDFRKFVLKYADQLKEKLANI